MRNRLNAALPFEWVVHMMVCLLVGLIAGCGGGEAPAPENTAAPASSSAQAPSSAHGLSSAQALWSAQALPIVSFGVSGDRFTINGTPTFLIGVSYFDATGWKTSDLDGFASRGINLIRIWLEDWSPGGNRFLDPDGNITDAASLVNLVRAAAARGIVVDATILDWESAPVSRNPQAAVSNIVDLLKNEPNVLFDLANEHNYGSGVYASHSLMRSLADIARSRNPGVILTVSECCGHYSQDASNPNALDVGNVDGELNVVGVDVLAPHFWRDPLWYARTGARVSALKSAAASLGRSVPIYLQEEARRRHSGLDPSRQEFFQAATEAYQAGAAGWVFHTDAGFELQGGRTFFGNLDVEERAVVDGLASAVFGRVPPSTSPPQGAGVALTVSPESAGPGQNISISVSNVPADPRAWIAVAHSGSADGSWLDWRYLNGEQHEPSAAITDATVTMTLPSSPGNYEVRLYDRHLSAGGRLLISKHVAVGATPPSPPSVALTVSPHNASPGQHVSVSVRNVPVDPNAWVAVAPAGSGDWSWLDWRYLNGEQYVPSAGFTDATVTLTLPDNPGNYEVRLYDRSLSTGGKLLISKHVAVGATPPSPPSIALTVSPHSASPGENVSVSVSNVPADPKAWVAVAPSGSGDWSWLDWRYLNGEQYAPSDGITAATVTMTLPSSPGNYEVRLYDRNLRAGGQLLTRTEVTVVP